MLRALVRLCLEHRFVVIVVTGVALVFAVVQALDAPLDVLPEFAPPEVTVQCEAPGFSPEQVEQLVTTPLEAAMSGAGGLEAIRSQSIQGLSIITAVFREDTEVHRARQLLSELLQDAAASLPDGVDLPRMTPLSSATMDLLKFGLRSDSLSPADLRSFAEFTVAPRLRAVPGVSSVTLFGGELRQVVIEIDPARLRAAGVGVDQVLEAARGATAVRGGGIVDTATQRILVDARGEARGAQDVAAAPLPGVEGAPLSLGDVAVVRDGAAVREGDCLIQGEDGVLVKTLSQYGANTLETTRALEEAIAELGPAFEAAGITVVPALHRPANFVETSIHNLGHSLWVGAALVAVVLFAFLLDLRAALISLTAIPLSLLGAVVLLGQFGFSLNTMTLGGLAIAIGEVVDDAIIDLENIVRRLGQQFRRAVSRPVLETVLDASMEVRGSVVHATFVVVLVFVPVILLSGLAGRFFAPLGIAYVLAVLVSLAVALTVTPTLCLVLLGRRGPRPDPLPNRLLRGAYEKLLTPLLRFPHLLLGTALALTVAAILLVPRFGSEFLPEFREGHFVLQVSLAPGSSLDETRRVGARISAELLANPHIATIEQQVGRSELSEDPWGPHRSEFHIELASLPPEVEAEVGEEIRAVLDRIPGIQTELLTFLGDRIGESISGETAQVAVSVFGEDFDSLDVTARRIESVLAQVAGNRDLSLGSLSGQPSLRIVPDRDRCRVLGTTPADVLDAVQLAFQGRTLGQVHDGPRVFDVTARLPETIAALPEEVGALPLRTADGSLVPLAELAVLSQESGRAVLLHEGGRRRQTVTCNVEGRDVASFVEQAKAKVAADVPLSSGQYLEWAGAAEEERVARRELLFHAGLAGLGVVLLLSLAFHRPRNLLLVLVNLPFAFVGGVAAVALTGGTLSMGSLVGFVTLFGITMRNSILMISHQEHLLSVEGLPFTAQTVVRGAADRLVPVLMTALVTGLGLLPIALYSGSAGREIEGPMACVILGGLVSSTVLTLWVLPALFLRYGRSREQIAADDGTTL